MCDMDCPRGGSTLEVGSINGCALSWERALLVSRTLQSGPGCCESILKIKEEDQYYSGREFIDGDLG